MSLPRTVGSSLADDPTVGRLVEVADGVLVHEQAPGGWCLSNAGVLLGDGQVVVVDTASTHRRAEHLREAVESLHAGPVQTLINTHHHGDHTFGNSVVAPGATVVAHHLARVEMEETGLALTQLWPDSDWGDIRLLLPTLTFADRMTLHIGHRRAELLHVGPAHTTNDVVVWLPDDRVLFTGDVVLSGAAPFPLFGSVAGTLDAVRRLRALGATTLVTGHGPVCGPEVFDRTESYLRRVQRMALRGREAGLSPLEVAREEGLGDFADLIDAERLVGSLHRAYAELEPGERARPLDVARIFGEMVEFNGGRLPTCLA